MKNYSPKNTVSYQETFKVKESDIDALNHVNNVVYLQWVNDIAEKHWGILSNAAINKKYFWVAIRHEIDYLQQAFLGDEITVCTWVGETGGVKSIRNVYIYKDETLLVKTKTTWCLIDVKTLKPTRIKEDITDLFIIN
ncbi:MAG: acyl-CoA thioesterase [Flavobacteriaceae bacterium]|nr:acyl-CoA thioesterase [Flavobacteriaceae bacterium]